MEKVLELISKGDELFVNRNYDAAYKCYYEAHMLNEALGTYKMAGCFTHAFQMKNLDNVDFENCRDYARKAIELYISAYDKFARRETICANSELKMAQVLFNLLFVKNLVNERKYDLPEEKEIMRKIMDDPNASYTDYSGNIIALFLAADIHSKIPTLIRLSETSQDKYFSIAASIKAYKHSTAQTLYTFEAGHVVENLIHARRIGAKFNVSELSKKLKIKSGERPDAEKDGWSDLSTSLCEDCIYFDESDYEHGRYDEGIYCGDSEDYYDCTENGFCDDDGFWIELDSWYPDE